MAIDPLEFLFKLVDWLEKESDKFLNEQTTIVDTIGFVHVRDGNRTDLKAYDSESEELQKLQKAAYDTSLVYTDLQKYDDRCLTSPLFQEISATAFEAGDIPSKIPTSIEEPSTTLAAKCAMIVQGALYLGDNATDPDAKIAFKAPLVWAKALSLLDNLLAHVSGTTALKLEDIKK
ncbi:hypothetical protein FIBSPDRAFT_1043725 [Athelia psychrophila]|uniref:Uncharacterized protein n=1 Tax=Athelia psychrophila TaxID=1759441 RepID=A0A166KUA7_9AGAM|nr:hypothetical protein FIBSPDRAFT_1043725 [Fibularhizoctonia sp. CBS 109695]